MQFHLFLINLVLVIYTFFYYNCIVTVKPSWREVNEIMYCSVDMIFLSGLFVYLLSA